MAIVVSMVPVFYSTERQGIEFLIKYFISSGRYSTKTCLMKILWIPNFTVLPF